MSNKNTLARLNNLPGYDPFQETVIFRKNMSLLLVDELQLFRYSIVAETWFSSFFSNFVIND